MRAEESNRPFFSVVFLTFSLSKRQPQKFFKNSCPVAVVSLFIPLVTENGSRPRQQKQDAAESVGTAERGFSNARWAPAFIWIGAGVAALVVRRGRDIVRRVAVTGMGIVSSLGNSLTEVCDSLRRARSGVELIPARKEMGFRSAIGGTLKGLIDLSLPKKYLRNMGQTARLAVDAAAKAISDASLPEETVRSIRTAIVVGNEGNMEAIHEQCEYFRSLTEPLGGSAMQRAMASSASANLAVLLGSRGPALTVATACASGATAIGLGYWLIKNGIQDRVICGGTQEFSWQSVCHLDALRVYSIREEAPQRASRPFDKGRDGFVPSCGAGIVVLEEMGQAQTRGARIRAELLGFATTSESLDMTVPSVDGCARCMAAALEDAGIRPDDVDYVNAHATSTKIGDVVEAQAIVRW